MQKVELTVQLIGLEFEYAFYIVTGCLEIFSLDCLKVISIQRSKYETITETVQCCVIHKNDATLNFQDI